MIASRSFKSRALALLLLPCLLVAGSQAVVAERFYVSPTGDDENPGTRSRPWKTMSAACLRLSSGDKLLVRPGRYIDENEIFVRYVDPDTFQWLPLKGTKKRPVQIRAVGRGPHIVEGRFDIRGSFITLQGLKIIGDPSWEEAGIGVFESHNIAIRDCTVVNHGASGIQFAFCDLVSAIGNVVAFNATTSPLQTSGISSFQPIVRTDTNERIGLRIDQNVSYKNENLVPNANGQITDGNGIIVDDHNYTQFNEIIADAVDGNVREEATGTATIGLDASGERIPYRRETLVTNNLCYSNGGRGIHFFESDNGLVSANVCFLNLRSSAFTTDLPRDESGTPFFLNGDLSIVDSNRINARWNLAVTVGKEKAAATELFFETELPNGVSQNNWSRNLFRNFFGPNVFTFGSESSSLSD